MNEYENKISFGTVKANDVAVNSLYDEFENYFRKNFNNFPPSIFSDFYEEIRAGWLTEKGKLPKRLTKILSLHGCKVTNLQKNDIGQICNRHKIDGSYTAHIVRVHDMDGQYGDRDACFYTSNAHHKHAMSQNCHFAALAIEKNGEPKGRTWVYFTDEGAVFFNLYGLKEIELLEIIKTAFQYICRPIVNSDVYQNRTRVIFATNNLDAFNYYSEDNRMIDIFADVNSYATCSVCHHVVDYYDAFMYDGMNYCPNCFRKHFDVCAHCEEIYPRHYLTEINYNFYCVYCEAHLAELAELEEDWA